MTPKGAQHPRASVCTSGKAQVPALYVTNMLHFQHSKYLKENVQVIYIVTDIDADYDSGKFY